MEWTEQLARQLRSPLEILMNSLYMMEHSSPECDPMLMSIAKQALDEIVVLVRDNLQEAGPDDDPQ